VCHPEKVRFSALPAALALALPLLADPRTQKLLDRLAEEASAFAHTAPNLISQETLRQRALKTGRQRARKSKEPDGPEAQWQTREIRSEYGFAKTGNPPAIREIRKVLSVDGKPVNEGGQALHDLVRSLQSDDDRTRRKLLEDFEKHGLIGTATDFGQLVLLFDRRSQEQYEFSFKANKLTGADWCAVFEYRQHEGPGALTVFDSKGRQRPQVAGEIWVARDNYRVLRITLVSARGQGASAVRDEAEVDYTMSPHAVVVPAAVTHREYLNGELVAENLFRYAPFQKFGASADIKFTGEPVR
jgi:hypothetical protein